MEITINIKKRYAYILALLLACTLILVVHAFNTNPDNLPNEPARLGHSGDELQVKIPRSTDPLVQAKTLQKAIEDGDLAARTKECRILRDETTSTGTYPIQIPDICINTICVIRLNKVGAFYSQHGTDYWFAVGNTNTGSTDIYKGSISGDVVTILDAGQAKLSNNNLNEWLLELSTESNVELMVCN